MRVGQNEIDLYQQVLVAGTRTLGLRENTGGCA